MSTQLKESTPVPAKGGSSPTSGGFGSSGYLPSGIMLATILKALRDAQSMELEIQRDQAEVEQEYYKQLGGIDNVKNADGTFSSDIHKGLMAMTAQSTIDSGVHEADGLRAQGISSAVNAGISGGMALGATGVGISNHFKGSGLDEQINQTKALGKQLDDGNVNAQVVVGVPRKVPDQNIETLIQNRGLNPDGTPNAEGIAAVKADPPSLQKARDDNAQKLKDLEKKQKDISESTNNWLMRSQVVGNVTQAATGAAGSIQQAKAKEEVAVDNASAGIQKQVQDMNYSSANTFKENAKTAAQQALQTSDTLAQVAQSQVQFRG